MSYTASHNYYAYLIFLHIALQKHFKYLTQYYHGLSNLNNKFSDFNAFN